MSLGFPSSMGMGARKVCPRVFEGDLDDMYGLAPLFFLGDLIEGGVFRSIFCEQI